MTGQILDKDQCTGGHFHTKDKPCPECGAGFNDRCIHDENAPFAMVPAGDCEPFEPVRTEVQHDLFGGDL